MREKMEIESNISYLNRKVMDIEDLKAAFIEKYGMLACKLLIYDYAENEVAYFIKKQTYIINLLDSRRKYHQNL